MYMIHVWRLNYCTLILSILAVIIISIRFRWIWKFRLIYFESHGINSDLFYLYYLL